MSLDTYAGLKASLRSWLNKSASVISDDVAADLIALCEAQMRREITAIGHVDNYADVEIDETGWALPCSADEVASVAYDGHPLPYLSPDRLGEVETTNPGYYTIDGNTLKIAPTGTVTLRLKRSFCPLSSAVSCNWLLREHPDAYLYGSLMQAAPFLRDDERTGTWRDLYTSALDSINAREVRRQVGGNIQVQAGVTP